MKHYITKNIGISFQLVSIILVLHLALLQLATALLFFADVPITKFHFTGSLAGSIIICLFLVSDFKQRGQFVRLYIFSVIAVIFLIGVSILISEYFYDFSWDGQAYHQETIIQLKEKWNPTREYLSAFTPMSDVSNYYSRGIETLQASVYSFTDHIESGKATNFILLFSSFFYAASFLIDKCNISLFKSVTISFLLVFNPVFVSQAFTYYIDAQIFFLYLLIFLSGINLFISADKSAMAIYFSSIILVLPAKFIAVPTAGIFIISFLIILLVKRKYRLFKGVFVLSVLASVTGLCIIGYQPYITNTINHGNPFFPFAGRGAAKGPVLVDQSPVNFPEKNRVEKLLISIFSSTENIQKMDKDRTPQLKIPFTFRESELQLAWDQRIGGFGPFYSGILILSFALLITIFNGIRKENRQYLLFLIMVTLITIFLISEAWWLRYVPQLWMLSFIIIVFYELSEKRFLSRIIVYSIYLFLIINISLIFGKTMRWNSIVTKSIDAQLDKIVNERKPLIVNFRSFASNRKRLSEHNISYSETKTENLGPGVMTFDYSVALMKYDTIEPDR